MSRLCFIFISVFVLTTRLESLEAAVPQDKQNVTVSPTPMTIKHVEKSIEKLITSATKFLLPYFVRNSDVNVTGSCMSALIKLFVDIRRVKLPAIKFLDAMAKPPYGLLHGSFAAMGEYDECLSIKVNSKGEVAKSTKDEVYHGQYCTVRINFPPSVLEGMMELGMGRKNISDFGKLAPFIEEFPSTTFAANYFKFQAGLCIPSTCTLEDLNEIIKLVLNFLTIDFIPVQALRCESDTAKEITADQVAIISVLAIVIFLMAFGSIADGLIHLRRNPDTGNMHGILKIILAFSIYRNTQKLLGVKKDTSFEVPCINGMYVLGTFLVVIYHTYLLPFFVLFSRNVANLGHYLNSPQFTLVSTMGISIEAYFLFSGLFLVYGRFKRGGKKTQVKVIKLLIRRYIRLCPSLMLILGIIIALPLVGSGPVWKDIAGVAANNGRRWWYTYIGMYNNFLKVEDQTYLYLWFIPCLMQITVIGAILAWILSRNQKLGIILIVLTAIACNLALGIITAINSYPPSYAIYFFHNREKFEIPIYTSPLSHVASFCIGMLLGYYMSYTPSVKWSKIHVGLGWIGVFLFTVGIQYLLYPFYNGQDVNVIFSSIYGATHRSIFSLGLAWIILACSYGYGGPMGKILSWKGFGVLSKLGYCAYLIHYLFIVFHVSYSRTPHSFSHFEIWIRICAYSMLTFIGGYILYIAFELPLNYLESVFLPERKPAASPSKIENESNIRHPDIVRFGDTKYFKDVDHYNNNNVRAMPTGIVFSNEQSHL